MSELTRTVGGVAVEDDPVAVAMREKGPDVLNRLNADFEDSVLLVGRVLGERPRATAARVVDIDRFAADLVVTDPDGEHRVRLPFATPITDIMKMTTALYSLVEAARERSGEEGTTAFERTMAEAAAYRVRLAEVVAVTDLYPNLRQITFGRGDLPTLQVTSPDTFLYVLLPPPGRTELTVDQSFSWDDVGSMPESERPGGAYYTVRRWRPAAAEIDMLFVLHDHDGAPGSASSWARTAAAGAPVALWGPRTSWHPPAGTDRYVLVADETGLPATAAILEQLPANTPVQVVLETADDAELQELPTHPNATVTWVDRGDAAPGTTTLLADAVRALPWHGGTPYVWGGGESHAMTRVRRYVRDERGLPRDAVSLVAYWRHGS